MECNSENIPRSLRGYIEKFRKDPSLAIQRLETHIEKRGHDAAGYYLLSWFHHRHGQPEKAVKAAWKAKIYAPGSPVMEQLHYFMLHPEKFSAWNPSRFVIEERQRPEDEELSHPIPDLDALIERLSGIEAKRIRIEDSDSGQAGPDLSGESSDVEDIVTETLALIHEQQGNREAAIRTYEKLIDIHPGKADPYRNHIERLRMELKENRQP